MKQIVLLLGTLITITAFTRCNKKEDPAPATAASYWTINNDTVAYRSIGVNTAPSLTELRMTSMPSADHMLSFAFLMGSLPHAGAYKVDYVGSDPGTCNVYVVYNGINYDVNPAYNITKVRISTLANGKGRYELEPTWFYKSLSPSDSVLVKGVIIEP